MQPEPLELNLVLHYVYSAAFLCSSSSLSRRCFVLCFLFPFQLLQACSWPSIATNCPVTHPKHCSLQVLIRTHLSIMRSSAILFALLSVIATVFAQTPAQYAAQIPSCAVRFPFFWNLPGTQTLGRSTSLPVILRYQWLGRSLTLIRPLLCTGHMRQSWHRKSTLQFDGLCLSLCQQQYNQGCSGALSPAKLHLHCFRAHSYVSLTLA